MTLNAPAMRNLREVIHSQAIQPTFQPVVRLEDGVVKAYEALARFDKAHFPNPADAFAAALAAGVGVDLELLALERAFAYLDEMPGRGLAEREPVGGGPAGSAGAHHPARTLRARHRRRADRAHPGARLPDAGEGHRGAARRRHPDRRRRRRLPASPA
nr:hypothetical protein GCM10020092_066170 [Actinoplanes digitatis]